MENLISKELLSEVLNKNISSYEFDMYGNIDYKVVNDYGSNINIYELAHKCKEWAFNNGFAFRIEYLGEKDVNIQLINCRNEKTSYSKDFYNIENIDDIIIPCQWILENKGNL